MNQVEKEISEAVFGKTDYAPKIHFYDHPVPDAEATERSNRPRFKEVVYVSIKPTHPDLSVKDFRSRAIKDTDQYQYPEQWQKYLATKDRIKTRNPSIDAIPGMTVSAHAELKALQIYDCEKLAAYEGDLAPYNHLKMLATRIMELANECKDLPEEREPVRDTEDRREQQQIGTGWQSPQWSNQQTQKENQEKSYQKTGKQEVTFNFEVAV